MIPDIQLQIKSVIKSLKDNVLPSVDADNELAQQQIQLSMATLEMALNNLPVIHGTLRKDLQQHMLMAKELMAVVSKSENQTRLRELIASTECCLQDPALGFTELQSTARRLRDGIGTVIADSDSDAAKVERVVLAHCEASLKLGRALNKATGFEPAPEQVPNVQSLLDA